MKNDEFWAYLICHAISLTARLVIVCAVLFLTWKMNNPWVLFGLVGAMWSYKHDYKRRLEDEGDEE